MTPHSSLNATTILCLLLFLLSASVSTSLFIPSNEQFDPSTSHLIDPTSLPRSDVTMRAWTCHGRTQKEMVDKLASVSGELEIFGCLLCRLVETYVHTKDTARTDVIAFHCRSRDQELRFRPCSVLIFALDIFHLLAPFIRTTPHHTNPPRPELLSTNQYRRQ